jgi:hypothetical protein
MVEHESDTPEHCEVCRALLDVRLTDDGVEYVREAIRWHEEKGRGDPDVIAAWRSNYRDVLGEG